MFIRDLFKVATNMLCGAAILRGRRRTQRIKKPVMTSFGDENTPPSRRLLRDDDVTGACNGSFLEIPWPEPVSPSPPASSLCIRGTPGCTGKVPASITSKMRSLQQKQQQQQQNVTSESEQAKGRYVTTPASRADDDYVTNSAARSSRDVIKG